MTLYFPYFIFYTVLSVVPIIIEAKWRKLVYFFLISLFLNFSYTNGIDWTSYQFNYENDPYHQRGIEVGYTAIVFIGKTFNLNWEFFKGITLTINLWIFIRFIWKFSYYPSFTMIILFQTFLLGNFFEPAIRQIFAISSMLIAIEFLIHKRFLWSYIFILLAMLFHQTAIIFLGIFLILPHINLINISISGTVLFVATVTYFENILLRIIAVPAFQDYAFYAGSSFLEPIDMSLFNIAKIIIYFLPVLYIGWHNKKKNRLDKNLVKLAYVFVLMFCMQFALMLFYRLQFYFVIPYLVVLSWLFYYLKRSSTKYIILIFFIFMHSISLYKGLSFFEVRDKMKFFPYTNFLYLSLVGDLYESSNAKIRERLYQRRLDMKIQ